MSDTLKEFNTRICGVCGYRSRLSSCPHDGTTTQPKGAAGLVGLVLKERYRLLQHLGSGGMGTVYKAEHLRLQTLVAVKILDASIASEQSEQYQRFHREGQVINSLVHPNIVRALDFDLESGKPFLVMDYVDGVSLQDVLRRSGIMEVKRALNIFTQICDAMGYAHNNGVLHRDLKPANVMLVSGPIREDRVKLLDFGLAKLVDSDAKKLTDPGMIFGTPLYMSPEQCLGNPMDHRSDIYSLGCLMYELLSGKPPMKGTSSIDTIQKQINETPLPLQEHRAQEIPPGLAAVIMKTLEKSPDDRPSSMAELKTMLERSLLPATFTEQSPAALKSPSRFLLMVQLTIAALVLLVAGGTVAYLMMPPRTANPETQAASQAQQVSAAQTTDRQTEGDSASNDAALAHRNIGIDYLGLHDYKAADKELRVALQMYNRKNDRRDFAITLGRLAEARIGLNDYQQGIKLLQQEMTMWQTLNDDNEMKQATQRLHTAQKRALAHGLLR